MSAASDVRAVRVTGTGTAVARPARLRGLKTLVSGGAGRLTLSDGNGGEVLFDVDKADGTSLDMTIPGAGIRFKTALHVQTLTNIAAVTFLYE